MTEPDEMPSVLEFAPDPFVDRLGRLHRLYREMGAAFGVEMEVLQEESKEAQARDPGSFEDWEYLIFEDEENDLEERERLRSEFILVFLASAVRGLLKETKSELEGIQAVKTPDRRGKPKKSRDPLRYFERFFQDVGIDLTVGSGWSHASEVILARDALVHPEGLKSSGVPRHQLRLLSEAGDVQLTEEELDLTLDHLRDFGAWLRKQVRGRGAKEREAK